MAHGGFKDVLKNGGFLAFLCTQFLGAFNDNAYRIIVSLRAVHIVAKADQSGKYLALAGAIFVLPSLLFTGYAGQLADAISKRKVLIAVKIFEIAVMALGIVVFFSQSIALMFVVLFLMAVHYTVFSPAKYSIVPELVSDRDLSRANALLEMTTLVAIVLGTSVGPFLFTAWKTAEWKMGVVLTTVAVIGCLTSFRITRVPAASARAPWRLNPFAEVGGRHPAPAARPSAVARGDGHLLLLVRGAAVLDGPGAVRQRNAARQRPPGGTADDLPVAGDRRGQHAGGQSLGRQSRNRTGAARLHLHGRIQPGLCTPRAAPTPPRW